MLKYLRQKNIAKIVFWFLVILILPAFVLWGTGNLSGSKEKRPDYVGIINNSKISFGDLAKAMTAMRGQIMLSPLGGQPETMDTLLKNKAMLSKLAWDRLIMLREALRYRIKVPDKDVVIYIKSHPLFMRDGTFDNRIYEHALKYAFGLDPRTFEETIRENLTIKKLNDMLTGEITVSDEDLLREYRRENAKFKLSYVIIDTNDYTSKVDVPDEAARDYYEKNKDEFLLTDTAKEAGQTEGAYAKFEDAKAGIKNYLAGKDAKVIAAKDADALYHKIKESMEKDNKSFEDAAAALNLKLSETTLFAKSDYLEGLGEAAPLAAAAAGLKENEISMPTETRRGLLIFKVSDRQDIDMEKFNKEKADYSQKVLNLKRDQFMGDWLRRQEENASLKIDLNDLDKYFK